MLQDLEILLHRSWSCCSLLELKLMNKVRSCFRRKVGEALLLLRGQALYNFVVARVHGEKKSVDDGRDTTGDGLQNSEKENKISTTRDFNHGMYSEKLE